MGGTAQGGTPSPDRPRSGQTFEDYLRKNHAWQDATKPQAGDGMVATHTPGGTVLSVLRPRPETGVAFTLKYINQLDGTVLVNGGHVYHGANVYNVADTEVEINGGTEDDPQQVVLEYTHRTGASILASGVASTDNDPPPQSDGVSRRALLAFWLDTSVTPNVIRRAPIWRHWPGGFIDFSAIYAE